LTLKYFSYVLDGSHRNEVTFIGLNDLNSPVILKILGHELGHLNTYDTGQNTADNVGNKINVSVTSKNTDGKHDDYLVSLRPIYEGLPSIDEIGKLSAAIPEDWKEDFVVIAAVPIVYYSSSYIADLISKYGSQIVDLINTYGLQIIEYISVNPEMIIVVGDKGIELTKEAKDALKDGLEKLAETIVEKVSNMPGSHFDPNRDREIIKRLIRSKPNG
jgi:hypothetical protein